MKSKTILCFSIILLLLIACNNKNKDIEGVWISAYKINEKEDYYPIPILIEFKNNKINILSLDVYQPSKDSGTYTYINGSIYTNFENFQDTMKVKAVSNDSLVLLLSNENFVFKKIKTKSNISKEDLIGNLYHIKGKYYEDTIDFINGYNFITITDDAPSLNTWNFISYNNLNFICLERIIDHPCFLIEEIEPPGNLKTRIFYKEDLIYNFKKLNFTEFNNNLLQGEWNIIKNISEDKNVPPPPPGYYNNPNYLIKESTIQKIYNDSLLWESSFKLNTTNEIIFFEKDLKPWKIIELSEYKLKVEIPEAFHLKNDTLEFWKQ